MKKVLLGTAGVVVALIDYRTRVDANGVLAYAQKALSAPDRSF